MARLNEPPAQVAPGPSVDTVDAVKRRFLRQNRELAKTNSQQSIRIRNLETEGSRLLAENLSLREQVLQLQNALESQTNRPSFENIDAVKSQLETKLVEFGTLIAELGQMQTVDTGPRCKSQTAATRRSPGERQWRSGLGLQDVENAMLPTITEDKYYPRRTMNADELRKILNDPDSQSPDIGPPPVSRFENEEPIAFDPSPAPDDQPEQPIEDPEPALSVNLETRRKRRESGPKLDSRRPSVFESPPELSEERPSKSVRAGAKRKFSVQEDEDKADFRFTRKHTPSAADDTASNNNTEPSSPRRPVLGTKPVNTDPVVSPKKQRSSATDKPDKKPPSTSKSNCGRLTITRTIQPDLQPFQLCEPIPTTEINLDSLPPKTPAAEDILSPPSTEPSTARPENRDTPPPGDLGSDDQIGLAGRPSRRARPQVSYKEPSLNSKMRRPGKELVDAVQPIHDRRTSVEPTPMTTGKPTVKREPDDSNSTWKSLALSGRSGDDEREIGSPLKEKLGRREGSQSTQSVPEQHKLNSSAASNAISALISATSNAKKKSPAASSFTGAGNGSTTSKTNHVTFPSNVSTSKQEEKDNLAVFDFTDSSPNEHTASRPRADLAKMTKSNRRHSSVPAASANEGRSGEAKANIDGSLPSLHSRSASGSAAKTASTSSFARNTSSTRMQVKDKKPGALPTSGSTVDVKAAIEGSATGSLRAERAASRRKSMML